MSGSTALGRSTIGQFRRVLGGSDVWVCVVGLTGLRNMHVKRNIMGTTFGILWMSLNCSLSFDLATWLSRLELCVSAVVSVERLVPSDAPQ